MAKKRIKARSTRRAEAPGAAGALNRYAAWARTPVGLGGTLAGLIVIAALIYLVVNLANQNQAAGGAFAGGSGAVPPAQRNEFFAAQGAPPMVINPDRLYTATIHTVKGDIVVQLDAKAAPKTVNNFVLLSRDGFYNGLTFHRVENNPVFRLIQGGDPAGNGQGGPGYTVPAEIGLKHTAGAIAMARTGDEINPERASSGSQFYVVINAIESLDNAYTVFGYVTQGLDVAEAVAINDAIQSIDIQEQ